MQNSAAKLILNIDVSQTRRAAHNRLLEENGFEIIDHSEASGALQIISEKNPVVVLLADSKIANQIINANHFRKPLILQIIETSDKQTEYFGDAFIKEPISEKELIAQTKILTRLYNAENGTNESKHSSLQEIVRLIPTVFYIYNIKTQRNEVITPHTAVSLGYSPEEFEQYNEDFTERFMHPDDRKNLPEYFARLNTANNGSVFENEYRMQHKSGKWLWFKSFDSLLSESSTSSPEKILGVAYNIHLQKQTYSRSLIQYKIARILTEAKTINEASLRILETICKDLDFVIGELWCFDKDESALCFENSWHKSSPEFEKFAVASRDIKFAKGEGLPGEVWSEKAPVWVEDLQTENVIKDAALIKETHLKSGVAFPILLGNKLLGVFSFFCTDVREPDEALLQMFAAAGNHIGQFIKRQKTEEKLRQSDERYRAFIRQSGEGIFRFEFDQRIAVNLPLDKQIEIGIARGYLAECNDAMAQMYGLERAEDLVGRRLTELFDMSDQANFEYFMRFLQSGYRLKEAESHEKDISGNDKYFLNSLVGIVQNGELIRIWGTQRDITDQKRLLESEAEAKEAAEAANQAKDEFIAVVSHELRSPLNAILGWARILQNKKVQTVKLEQALDTIIRNARTQSKLIEDLLDTTRISRGKLRLETQTVDPVEIIKSAIEIHKPSAEAKEIVLSARFENETAAIVGDTDRLQQIFGNLLSNAVKFTPKGGSIDVSVSEIDSQFVVCVKDTGIGISDEFLPKIFDQFAQSDPNSIRRYGGLGIGLALTKKLVEMHSGTISAQSDGDGKGATFTVCLPLR